jgi:hypothetical protein
LEFLLLEGGQVRRTGYPGISGVDPSAREDVSVWHEHVPGVADPQQYFALLA